MWIKTTVGNHYGLYEVTGVEMYKESEESYILYGYLPRPVPDIPVTVHESLRDGIPHIDFVKVYQFASESEAKNEIDRIQNFMDNGAGGVYEVRPECGTGIAKSA